MEIRYVLKEHIDPPTDNPEDIDQYLEIDPDEYLV